MKRKQFNRFKNELINSFFSTKVGTIISNWVAQGMLYMNKYEIGYRIFIEIIVISIFVFIFHKLISLKFFKSVVFSFLLTHSLFWILNGHFFVLMRYIVNWKNNPQKFINYVKNLQKRVERKKFILGAAVFGSVARGNFSVSSDLDLRLIRKRGFLNTFLILNYCIKERFYAFFHMFPLDVYVFDIEELTKKINPDEPALILSDPLGVLKRLYREKIIEFDDFYDKVNKKRQ